MQTQRSALTSLTGIRFFAAIHVVFFHYAPGVPHYLRNIVENGYLAVGLFFLLSGFILAYNYGDRETDTRRFWLARFARIYPAYLLGFLLIAPAVIVRLQDDPGKLAASGLAAVTLLQGWIPGLALVWNGPGWSLSVEAFFYLLFPLMLPVLARLSIRSLWLAGGACCLLAALAGEKFMYVPLFRLPEFGLGIVTGLLFLRGVRIRGLLPASIGLGAFAVLSPDYLSVGLRGAVAAPLFAMLVFSLACDRGMVNRFLGRRRLQKLGDASYAIYILQSPVMAYFLLGTQGIGTRAPLSWVHFWIYCTILIGISLACYRWLETPARRWIVQMKMVPSDPISSLAHHRHARY